MRVLLTLLALFAVVGCRGDRADVPGDLAGAGEPSPARRAAVESSTVRLSERTPTQLVTPVAPSPATLETVIDSPEREDVIRIKDARGEACWLVIPTRAAASEASVASGEAPPRPTVTVDRRSVPEGEVAAGPYFVFEPAGQALVVSTARDQKMGRETRGWTGSAEATFVLPKGETRLALRAPQIPEEAPPLEIQVWVDGQLLGEEFLTLGAMWESTVPLETGAHVFELRCPRLQRVEWGHLVSPIELVLEVEADVGVFRLFGWDSWPAEPVEITYPVPAEASGDSPRRDEPFDAAPLRAQHRRVERGCCSHDVLLAPTPTVVSYEIDVASGARLLVGLGQTDMSGEAGPVHGEILVDTGAGPRVLWSGAVSEGDGCESWFEPLSLAEFAGQRATLTFATRSDGEGGGEAYWIDPTVVTPAPDGENIPSVILVSIDTLRADHLGCYGYGRPTSPILDGLAAGATRYERAYTTYPTTMLAHMALLRGTHPDGLGRTLAHEAGVDPTRHPPEVVEMVQQRLRRRGFSTAAFTGGRAVDKHYGFDEGFGSYCDCALDDSAAALADRATRWLEVHAGAPFFLFLHTYEVHGPYAPPDGFTEQVGGAADLEPIDPYLLLGHPADPCAPLDDVTRQAMIDLYDGGIRYTDEALVGRLLDTLSRLDLDDDTLLVVTSDHGEEFGEHGCWLHGSHLYEETVHVPLIVRYPGGQHRGEVVAGPVSLVDVAPTILAAVGLDHADMQGTPLPRTSRDEREAGAVARGVRFDVDRRALFTAKAFVSGQTHKLVHSRGEGTEPRLELYDLRTDPTEELDHLVGGRPDAGAPAHAELLRLLEFTESVVGQPLLELEGAGEDALPPELGRQLEALGYTR